MRLLRGVILFTLIFLGSAEAYSQEAAKDSVFRLLYADEARQLEEDGLHFRRVKGNADFFHNNAHLYCDSASWNIDGKYIEAFGNVKIAQDNTILSSEQLIYNIDESVAHFNGGVVELVDKDGNMLRTMELDYNTRDSVGFFSNGGAMKDNAGNVIESLNGSYRTSEGVFEFNDNVEMYMDTIRIRTTRLTYMTDSEVAYFGMSTHMWKDDGFLKADDGWYNRKTRVVHFENEVYMNDPQYEAWSDDMYYYQDSGKVDMFHNSQILDTTHRSYYTGDHILYERDSVDARVTMSRNPAVIFFGENENNVVDTLYFGADTINVYSLRKCDIPETEIKEAEQRLSDITFDTLQKKREELAAIREKERLEKLRAAGLAPLEGAGKKSEPKDSTNVAPPLDSSQNAADSLFLAPPDSIPSAPDTTLIRYIFAYHNVKMYRSDSQGACDSLVFSAVDSVARMYGSPILWNEEKTQLTSETMQFLMKNGNLHRGNMVTDAWLISQEDSVYFDQIKCTEMMGFFHENKLYRFDALGGVNSVFYLAEQERLTTVNVKSSKSMSAMIKDGHARRMLYMEEIKSDAYPIFELEKEKHKLKDFLWRGDERPTSPSAVTSRIPKSSERERFSNVVIPSYSETDLYFDGYMSNVLDSLERRRLARIENKRLRDSSDAVAGASGDELPAADTLSEAAVDMAPEVLAPADSSSRADILAPFEDVGKMSPAAADIEKKTLSRAEKRALKKAERRARREARKAARKARREARRAARHHQS